MEIIAVLFFVLAFFSTINLLFSILYFIGYTVGNGFYKWAVHDLGFLITLTYPLFGPTQYVASNIYNRFNWAISRVLIVCYFILLIILVIVFFYLFSTITDKM